MALKHNIDGIIVGSTIPYKSKKTKHIGRAGVGGKVTQEKATESLWTMYKLTEGKIPLISSGGIFTGRDVYERMQNGASLVQIYSAFAYRGYRTPGLILDELHEEMEKEGVDDISSIVGSKIE